MLWLISRESHNEIVGLLKAEIAELKAERRQTLDYILQQSAGRGLFTEVSRPVPIQELAPSGYFARPTNEGSPITEDVRSARHPRAALAKLQKDVNDQFDNNLSEAQKLIRETQEEGLAAANAE